MREENSCCTRQCCGPNRPFNFHVTDHAGMEVLELTMLYHSTPLPATPCHPLHAMPHHSRCSTSRGTVCAPPVGGQTASAASARVCWNCQYSQYDQFSPKKSISPYCKVPF